MRIVRPPPGVSSAISAPPIASTKPRATASPSPTPAGAAVVERAGTARTSRSRSAPATPGAVVDDLELRAARRRRARVTSIGSAPPPWRSALSSRLASTRSSRPGSACTSGRSSGTSTVDALGRVRQRRAGAARRPRRARPAAVCTASAPAWSRLASSRLPTTPSSRSADSSIVASSSSRSLVGPVDVGLAQAADRGLDPGQRRAQVVADGGEQRGALAVDVGERRAPRSASPLSRRPSYAVCGRGGERLAAPAGPRRTAPGRGRPAAGRGPIGTSKRSGASLAGGRPAGVLDVDPLAARRARAPSAPPTPCRTSRARGSRIVAQRLRARRGRRRRAPRASRPRRAARSAARARRAASSTAPLTSAATATKTTSATRLIGVGDVERVERVDEEVVDQQRRGDRRADADDDPADRARSTTTASR